MLWCCAQNCWGWGGPALVTPPILYPRDQPTPTHHQLNITASRDGHKLHLHKPELWLISWDVCITDLRLVAEHCYHVRWQPRSFIIWIFPRQTKFGGWKMTQFNMNLMCCLKLFEQCSTHASPISTLNWGGRYDKIPESRRSETHDLIW